MRVTFGRDRYVVDEERGETRLETDEWTVDLLAVLLGAVGALVGIALTNHAFTGRWFL